MAPLGAAARRARGGALRRRLIDDGHDAHRDAVAQADVLRGVHDGGQAVFQQEGIHPERDAELRMCGPHAHVSVDRDEGPGVGPLDHLSLLGRRCVARGVDTWFLAHGRDARTGLPEALDEALDHQLVSRNDPGREDDVVTLAQERTAREPVEPRAFFALRPGDDVEDLVALELARPLLVDELTRADAEPLELARDLGRLLDGVPEEADLPAHGPRGDDDRLQSVGVRREARDEHTPRTPPDDAEQVSPHDLLAALTKPGTFAVGAVRQEHAPAVRAVLLEAFAIDRLAVLRIVLDLEVARVDDRSGRGRDRKRVRVGDAVRDPQRLDGEPVEVEPRARLDEEHVSSAFELRGDEPVGEPREEDLRPELRAQLLQEVGEPTDVVHVPVRHEDAQDVRLALDEPREVRNRHGLGAIAAVLVEAEPSVDHEDLAVLVPDGEAVVPHVRKAAQSNDFDHLTPVLSLIRLRRNVRKPEQGKIGKITRSVKG